ncbi:uncharacterized protein LOC131940187 [Physella acuta]|uniref:uncharacterized protein LOC131940187 n=1 Tax=Physella acuta TaxID=109671 RepID=UPI0027DD2E47|nr:uncharacterized protein LOC131940187 [Physella acuta]XP_059154796.1 uncharacterized protein LOC131940187 [Physella acuta]XP_059154797.1 uncharacterized protein LOC131940187 [Physella acuta]
MYWTALCAVTLLGVTSVLSWRQNQTWPSRVYPGQLGFPDHVDFAYIGQQLDGDLISPFDDRYMNASYIHNIRKTKLPGFIVVPSTIQDVQRAILYARRHNLHLTVRSSGHDYIGRSTHDGSLNLFLISMNRIEVKLDSVRNKAGEVKVQTGASWLEVYTEVDKVRGPDESGTTVGRVVVGGSAHTVAMGGYTQGGGHSPIGRQFGLAADNLLEATIVTADGKIRVVNASMTLTYEFNGTHTITDNTDLFWAIRGGGGGTWGVVVDFTFKLHYAPERFRNILAVIPLFDDTGFAFNKKAVADALKIVNGLSPDWGGYVITSPDPVQFTTYTGSLFVFFNHFGSNSSASNSQIDPLLKHPAVIYSEDHWYKTFLEYEVHAVTDPYGVQYVFNSFIQPETLVNNTTLTKFVDLLHFMLDVEMGCAGTLIGGNMAASSGGSTPIHPAFRTGIMAMTCGKNWPMESGYADEDGIEATISVAERLYAFGTGSYLNEPAEDMPDWKNRFWGNISTYDRLLEIKKRYDPDNYLWCHNCVGSDLGPLYSPLDPNAAAGVPGQVTDHSFKSEVEFDQIKTPVPDPTPTPGHGDPIIG